MISWIGVSNFSDFLLKLDKLKNIPGLDKVLQDLTIDPSGWRKYVGAKFVVDYISNKGDDFISKISAFEEAADIVVDGVTRGRVYDLVADGIKYEFKNWAGFYSTTIRSQFIRDLANESVESLDQIKWIFKETSEITDISSLKTKVISALRKADGDNLVPIQELESIPLEKIRKWTGNNFIDESSKSQAIIDFLDNENNFKQIFEVAK